jgi:DNA-directed RNA polymerase specialized sigma24 family protein
MQQLRPQEREVLELSVNQGMSQSQIAETWICLWAPLRLMRGGA